MPSDKRARQRAAREMRLAAEAKAKKRRKQIRNAIIVVVIAGVIILIVFLTSSNSPQEVGHDDDHHPTTAPTTTSTTVAGSTTTTLRADDRHHPGGGPVAGRHRRQGADRRRAHGLTSDPARDGRPDHGNRGGCAKTGDSLTVQYVLATYSSRKTVQSSWTSQPFTLHLGQGVIQGWDDGVVGMKVGGRPSSSSPRAWATAPARTGSGIAANDTLVFVIDLVTASV